MNNKKANIIFKLLLFLSGAAFLVITTPRNKTSVIVHCAAIFLLLIAVILLPIKYETPGKKKKFVFLAGIVIGIYVCSKISWKFYMAWKPANTFILIAQNLGVSHKLLLKGFSIATAAAAIPFLAYVLTCAVCKTIAMSSEKRLKAFSWAFLLGAYFSLLYVINMRMDNLLNSDDSSELILAQLLAEENGILTPNWYYSTELRVLNTQLIYSFFFRLFDNWHTVRMMSLAIMYVVLAASCYYICKCLNCKRYGILTSAMLLMPISNDYLYIVLRGAYYIPHICISFVGLGLAERYIKANEIKKRRVLLLAASILALIAGMGGPRQIIVLYFPLALAGILLLLIERFFTADKKLNQESIKYLCISTICLLSAGIGYAINAKLLSKIYSFKNWNNICYAPFSTDRLNDLIVGFMDSFGWASGKVFSFATITNGICALLLVCGLVSVIYGIRHRAEDGLCFRMSIFSICALTIFVLLYLFTNMNYSHNYNLPVIVWLFPTTILMLSKMNTTEAKKAFLVCGIALAVLISSTSQYKTMLQTPGSEFKTVSSTLVEQGYYSGYATFWNANVLTELSNGRIEVWDIGDYNDKSFADKEKIDEYIYTWLQYKSHVDDLPDGKVFVLLSSSQYDNCNWKSYLKEKDIIYKSDKYYIYGYENYYHIPEEMRSH